MIENNLKRKVENKEKKIRDHKGKRQKTGLIEAVLYKNNNMEDCKIGEGTSQNGGEGQ